MHTPVAENVRAADVVALLAQTSHARAFAPGPLPPMALRRILEAGRLAPSLYNTQPFRFVVVRERAGYERLRAAACKSRDTFFKGLAVFSVLDKKLKNSQYRMGLERQRTGEVLPEHGTAIVVLQDPAFAESVEACACALMAMALEATSCGLASQFTSWPRGLSFQKDMVAFLRVPSGFKIFTSLIVGNPVAPLTAAPKDRRPFDDAVVWL